MMNHPPSFPPFALNLSKGFSFLKRREGLGPAQPERKED